MRLDVVLITAKCVIIVNKTAFLAKLAGDSQDAFLAELSTLASSSGQERKEGCDHCPVEPFRRRPGFQHMTLMTDRDYMVI